MRPACLSQQGISAVTAITYHAVLCPWGANEGGFHDINAPVPTTVASRADTGRLHGAKTHPAKLSPTFTRWRHAIRLT